MNRTFWIDLIRVICTFLVIAIHVSGRTAGGYATGEDFRSLGLAGWISLWMEVTTNSVAVPMFVMISGALLLGRNETMGSFYRKRFGKILLPFLAWSCIFILCLWVAGRDFKDGTPITLTSSIGAILSGNVSGHFWFMYMLISLYIVAPFLSVFVRNAPRSMLVCFLILWFVAAAIYPLITYTAEEILNITEISGHFRFELVSLWVGFFVAGFVLKDVLISKRFAFVLIVIWFCFSLTAPVIRYLQYTNPDSILYVLLRKYVGSVVSSQVVQASIAFLILRSLGDLPALANSRFGRMVTCTAPLTFGIYLCHHLVLTPTMEILNLGACTSWLLVLCAIPILTVVFYFAAAIPIYIVRLNRYTKFLAP